MSKSAQPKASWLDFELFDDHIETGSGAARREHYLLRMSPKNMEILGLQERLEQEAFLQTLLDGSEQIVPSFFIMDKTEGLGHIRGYQQELLAQNPKYEFVYEDILKQLDGMEAESAAVERAFYMRLTVRERSHLELFCTRLRDCMPFYIAQREEWIVVLRNFLLREYTTFTLAEFDQQIELVYQQRCEAQQKRKRPKSVDRNAIIKEETRRMLLPYRQVFNTRYCEQNDFLRKTVAIRNYPAEFNRDCVLRQLGCLENTSVMIDLKPIKKYDVKALVDKQSLNSKAKGRSRKASEQTEAGKEQDQIREAYEAILENNERMFDVTILIEVYASNKEQLERRMERLKNLLLIYGITKDDLIYQQREGFLSMLPFGKNEIALSRQMPSSTFAALYPFTSSKKVDDQGLLIGRTASRGPVIWDPFQRDDAITSGNFLVIGNPGQGKSYLVKKIAAQLIAKGVSVYMLDPENECGDLFRGMGCSNIECGIGGYIINPLEVRMIARRDDVPSDEFTPQAFKESVALKQHLSWLREFLLVLFPSITDRELDILSILLREHYVQYGIDDSFDPRTALAEDYPTFGTLFEYIQSEQQVFDNSKHPEFDAEDLRSIMLKLREVYDGSMAAIFNGITNVPNNQVINFQLQTLLQGSQNRMAAVMFNIMTWVMNKLVADPKQKQAFLVDELYLLIDRKNPILLLYLRNYAKRDRKYEGILGLITQNLGEFDDPEVVHITSALLQLPPHKFIFHLGDVDPMVMHRLLGLEESEAAAIKYSRKRHCLLKAGSDKYYMEVGTLPYEAALFGTAGGR